MDIATLRRIEERDHPTIYTGLGNSQYMQARGIQGGVDMDWWETRIYEKGWKKAKVTYLPSQHFSARGITDRNKALWGGFALEVAGKSLYFAGDTGYGKFIMKIREHFPEGFDVGLLPIGAYKPKWFIAKIHTWPKEALQMQIDLNIKTGLAIHWGVFALADDGQDDPINDLTLLQKRDEYRHLDFRAGPSGTVWEL